MRSPGDESIAKVQESQFLSVDFGQQSRTITLKGRPAWWQDSANDVAYCFPQPQRGAILKPRSKRSAGLGSEAANTAVPPICQKPQRGEIMGRLWNRKPLDKIEAFALSRPSRAFSPAHSDDPGLREAPPRAIGSGPYRAAERRARV
jgi:hypothetical protein